MKPAKIRVLVAEDSVTVRKHICEILAADPSLEIVGEAGDGKSAIEQCGRLRPDVITMDMMMPVISGLAATEYIMAHFPTPILIVSASTNRGDLLKTYDALAAGAVDVFEKAGLGVASGAEQRLRDTVRLVSRIRVITHPRGRLGKMTIDDLAAPTERPSVRASLGNRVAGRACRVVAIGASTGGPGAIVDIFRALPAEFPIPILLLLHISDMLAVAFADWLEGTIGRPVSYGREGEVVAAAAGKILVAPPGRHMSVSGSRIAFSDAAERHSCRPSIDVLFETVATEYGDGAFACLLTGMGRDGAAGLLNIRNAGGFTVAQDEATSIVYGMPREAVNLGAAVKVLPLGEIGPLIASLAASGAWWKKT